MISFIPAIKYVKPNGFASVYIRVTKDRKIGYIRTSLIVGKGQHNGKTITDHSILAKTYLQITEYSEKCNSLEISKLTLSEIISEISNKNNEISFSEFHNTLIAKFINESSLKKANDYKCAINSLSRFLDKENINFSDITSQALNGWIESLKNTSSAKSKYPILIKSAFEKGLLYYNDYDRGIIKIKSKPFYHVSIPKPSTPKKRSISKENLLKIFNFDTSQCKRAITSPLAKDFSKLVFCLAGINAIDLFYLEKLSLKDGKLCYNRKKTANRRSDRAYIEIKAPEILLPLFEKYQGSKRLFSFSELYKNPDDLTKYINKGLEEICNILEVEKVTVYAFRHSWATIARNHCGASDADVAFALNHTSEYKVTRGYIEVDYSPIDILNEKVINYVLG